MEKKIRKLIIGFFALMLSFTMLSRAADSVTVAKVQVTKIKPGNLSYELKGTGIIKENSKKYVELESGYKISDVFVEKGQQVEEGELLFAYDLEKLREMKAVMEAEYQKLKLNYQKTGLSEDDLSGIEAAVRAKENAREDVDRAEQALTAAKNTLMEKKQEEYETASAQWKEITAEAETARKNAERAVVDAETELSELMEPQLTAEAKIRGYANALNSGDAYAVEKARMAIFQFYYNGTYEEHLNEIEEAKKKLKRAEEDLGAIQYQWAVSVNIWDQYSSNPQVKQAFYEQMAARDVEIRNAERTMEDIQKSIDRLTQKDTQIDSAINDYYNSIQQEGPLKEDTAYNALYQILYDNLKVDEEKIAAAKRKLARAREDAEACELEWEKKEDISFTKKEELNTELIQMMDGIYQYKEELDNVRTDLENAKRVLETAEYDLQKAMDVKHKQDRGMEIDLRALQLDLNTKKTEIDQVQSILKKEGKITAPASGTVITIEIEQGIVLNGQEKIVIATGGFELSMEADKEDIKPFSSGDEISIKGRDDQKIQSQIEYIELPDQNGKVRFTALLPEGDYQTGASLDFEVKKSSEDYSRCIPIQAIRKDATSEFILLSKESDSVLGRKETAFRLDVTVVSQDANRAAIDGALTAEDLVIYSSNKNIAEGDRVRVVQTE